MLKLEREYKKQKCWGMVASIDQIAIPLEIKSRCERTRSLTGQIPIIKK